MIKVEIRTVWETNKWYKERRGSRNRVLPNSLDTARQEVTPGHPVINFTAPRSVITLLRDLITLLILSPVLQNFAHPLDPLRIDNDVPAR